MNPNRCIAQSRFRIIDIIFRRRRNHILKCNALCRRCSPNATQQHHKGKFSDGKQSRFVTKYWKAQAHQKCHLTPNPQNTQTKNKNSPQPHKSSDKTRQHQASHPHEMRKGHAATPRAPFAFRGAWGGLIPPQKKTIQTVRAASSLRSGAREF